MKKEKVIEETKANKTIKKVFKEIYFDDFEDPCEDFTDALYDLIPEELIVNELKKIKGIKSKKGKVYSIEKVRK